MEIGNRFTDLIDYLALSRAEFCSKTGISQAVVSHIASGRNKPGYELIQRILIEFPMVSPDWLLLGKGNWLRKQEGAGTEELIEKIKELRIIAKEFQENIDRKLVQIEKMAKG